MPYAELHCVSNFSFLRGASHPEELVAEAARQGYRALAITDECSLAGVVKAHVAAREHGLHTCAQEAWTVWHKAINEFLGLPPTMLMFCGMAMGHADENHPVNRLHTERAELDEFATFRGL